jgi:hypothetical protein
MCLWNDGHRAKLMFALKELGVRQRTEFNRLWTKSTSWLFEHSNELSAYIKTWKFQHCVINHKLPKDNSLGSSCC